MAAVVAGAGNVAELPVDTGAGRGGQSAIGRLRARIDEIDNSLIALWRERASLSHQLSDLRVATGGVRVVLSADFEVLARFRDALGSEGAAVALLLVRPALGHVARVGAEPDRPI
jgi:chorismate mutase